MRKLKLQMQVSADGFVAGPEGELDWMIQETDMLQLQLLDELTTGMDTIIMGRGMAEDFINHWEHVVNTQRDSPDFAYAKKFVDSPKIVFSRTLTTQRGENVSVENGDLVDAIHKLKKQQGKDIIVYGGAGFVSSLISNNVIDELNLFINPVAIGNGLKIFHERIVLQLIKSVACANGIVINRYVQPAT